MQALAVVEDSVAPTIQKASKKTVNALETKSLKALTKKIIIPNADDDDQDDVPLVKSKPKGKRVSETKPQGKFLLVHLPISNAEAMLTFD